MESQHPESLADAQLRKEMLALRAALDKRRADRDLIAFTKYTYDRYRENWHHRVVGSKLDALIRGDIKRLMLFQPPRTGKSELVSRRLPSFALGVNPSEEVLSCSYGSELAQKLNRDVQRIMSQDEYALVFPNSRIPKEGASKLDGTKYLRNNTEFELMGERGRYRCAGVGGSITGTGFTLGIIDDPVKNREEADSENSRDKIWDWYTSTFYTRKEENARILLTMTRWHDDDLAGRLLKQAKKDPKADQWEVVILPAIRTDDPDPLDQRALGDPLWPDKYPLEELLSMKATMGSRDWSALMQQSPIQDGGNIVQRAWWRYYDEAPTKFDEMIQSWDLTFKEQGSSYVCGQVWGRKEGRKYLLDQYRAKVGFTETIRAIQMMSTKWPNAMRKLVEDKANGPAVIDALKGKLSGILACKVEGSKESRVHAVSPQIEAGDVYLPRNADWVQDYLKEWSQFPNGANDDQVDASTQALKALYSSGIERLERLLKM